MTAWLIFTVAAVACIVAGGLAVWPAAWWRGFKAGHREALEIVASEYERGYNTGWDESAGDDDER